MDVANCILEGNPDAVEFCPDDLFHHILAVSTYTLQEGLQPTRLGSILLFNVDAEAGQLKPLHNVETAGVFDIKWNPIGTSLCPMLAQADADGYLRVYSLEGHSSEPETTGNFLKEINSKQVSSSSMCLCLDWNPSVTLISTGLSDGYLSVISFTESQISTVNKWKAHEYELWTTSFDSHQPNLLYTGSDDCKFSCWDLRDDPSKWVFQNKNVHKMGICSIVKNPNDPTSLLTGSYDEYLRVWDVRSLSKPVNERAISMGGGVWRIKFHPVIHGLVLAACMHNGFSVVKIHEEKAEVIENYNKHGSLAYGADWQKGEKFKEGKMKSDVVATCSFYDRLLCVWKPESIICLHD